LSKNIIICRLVGGLGNQLFGYAAARRLALASNIELVIDNISGFKFDKVYKRTYQLNHFDIPCRLATPQERLEPFSRIRRYFYKRINRLKRFDDRLYISQEKIDFDNRLLGISPKNKLIIEGYWQSEKYFTDYENDIRSDLKIKPPSDAVNQEMAFKISQCNAVAIHLRFFDADLDSGNNIAAIYYTNAIREIEHLYSDVHYFIFSDRPDLARVCLKIPQKRLTLVNHNKGDDQAYADLWLMSQCKHFIIANSTFSWWGAWLSKSPNKTVIAPGFEKRVGVSWWGFDGLIPDNWIKISCE